jgi:tryptophan synthase alpha chain
VYAISRTGITGTQQSLASDAKGLVSRLRCFTDLPIAVGFGISNAEHFAAVGEFADAAVIGSALVRIVEEDVERGAPEEAPSSIARFIKGLRTPVLQAH